MYISPNLIVLLIGALALVLGKSWANRCYYRDVQSHEHCHRWHSGPTQEETAQDFAAAERMLSRHF